jgi:hypothetical protein
VDWENGNRAIGTIGSMRSLGSGGLLDGSIVDRHLETTCLLFTNDHVKSMKMNSVTEVGSSGAYKYFTMRSD